MLPQPDLGCADCYRLRGCDISRVSFKMPTSLARGRGLKTEDLIRLLLTAWRDPQVKLEALEEWDSGSVLWGACGGAPGRRLSVTGGDGRDACYVMGGGSGAGSKRMLPSLSYPGTSLLYFSGPQFLCLQTGLTHSCSAHILVKMRGVLSVLQGPDRQRQRCASICKEPASLGSCSLLRQPREVSSSFFCRRRNGDLEMCLRLPSPLQAELTQHQAAAPPGFPELRVPEPCLPSGCGHSLRWGEAAAAPTAPHPQAGFWREGLDWQHAQVWQLLGTPKALVGKSLQCWGSGPRHDKAERVLCNQRQDVLGSGRAIVVV